VISPHLTHFTVEVEHLILIGFYLSDLPFQLTHLRAPLNNMDCGIPELSNLQYLKLIAPPNMILAAPKNTQHIKFVSFN
jgi:hypothetical protein